MLDIWSKSESIAGTKYLVQFIFNEHSKLFDPKNNSTFFEQKEKENEFTNWLFSDDTLEKLQRKFFEYEAEDFAEKISWAEQIIADERKNKAQSKG